MCTSCNALDGALQPKYTVHQTEIQLQPCAAQKDKAMNSNCMSLDNHARSLLGQQPKAKAMRYIGFQEKKQALECNHRSNQVKHAGCDTNQFDSFAESAGGASSAAP